MRKTVLTSPWLFACLALPVAAQQKTFTFDVRDLLFQRSGAWPAVNQDGDARMQRLGELADAAVRLEEAGAWVTMEDQGYLVLRCDPAQSTRLLQMLNDLRRGKARPTDLLISMIRMPALLAAESGLQDGKSKEVTPADMTQLLRKVQEARGTLANLPEIRTHTLHAFDALVPQRAAVPSGPPVASLVACGQLLTLGDVAALHLQLCEAPPKGDSGVATPEKEAKSVWSGVLAVGLGKGVLMTRVQGSEATVMWVRVLAIGAPVTPPEPATGAAKTGK